MDFKKFQQAVQSQFNTMTKRGGLFVTATEKDTLWDVYLGSFPEGTNPIFRERTEHDCQCCKQFIRACGNVVAIIDGELVSIWDISIGGTYQVVADAMSKEVCSREVSDIFLHYEEHLGTDHNFDNKSTDPVIRFDHFHYRLQDRYVNKTDRDAVKGEARTNKEVLRRSLEEINTESAETVLELIEQGSLYRGEEHRPAVESFIRLRRRFVLTDSDKLHTFCWRNSRKLGGASKIRNTVIGTLMTDISNGVDLTDAVRMFESKVAPENYKRPTALITQAMIKKAQAKVGELGIVDSLPRRYAVMDDITINNVLFADRSVKKSMGVFDEMTSEVKVNPSKFDKVEEISIDNFVEHVLPTATSLELMFENRHTNNLMSVIAPVNLASPNILKWDNNFSWSYNGEVTDSIKERVKRAGGNVEGVLRCSLSWFNGDDLDIHVKEPGGNTIYYGDKWNGRTSGKLDVDMNAGGPSSRNAVENIVWTDRSKMEEGEYRLVIHNYNQREKKDVGFIAEIEYNGQTHTFPYSLEVGNGRSVEVAKFKFTWADGIEFVSSIGSTELTKEEWGISTQTFIPISMIMQSPNHWDGQKVGNKHWFFILEGCNHEGKARGLFNEFLKPELNEHRKVFEVLGSKMKTEESDDQLSGLGYSSTKRDSVLCNVTGSFNRIIKIMF